MNLIIFDIDGTLVDSVKVDDQCFIRSFKDLHNIDLSRADWNNFEYVTDRGLTNEIFRTHFKRTPSEEEIIELKSYFYNLLEQRIDEIAEISGATQILNNLIERSDYLIAFATGGWRETALLKLNSVGLALGEATLISSNDHFDRSEITKLAIQETLTKSGLIKFDTITYIGDGLWDFNSALQLGINFIGIDSQRNNQLLNAGAVQVINNLEDLEQIIAWTK